MWSSHNKEQLFRWTAFFLAVKGPAAGAKDAPQPWGFLCNPVMKMTMMIIIFCPFPNNGAPVEWNWEGKTEVLGGKPVPVPLCPPQIAHGLIRDRTRASAMEGRQLTAWAMARPCTAFTGWILRITESDCVYCAVRTVSLYTYNRFCFVFLEWCNCGKERKYNEYMLPVVVTFKAVIFA
jgi:hypothetical protein